ncbi:MAG: J domain-containing protein [Lysobacter sp.]|nr:J domain-containing protein [Lysobacter sp.]
MHNDPPPDPFGATQTPAADAQSLKPTSIKAKASPLQREFDRLVGRIEACQALLTAWRQQPAAILEKYHAKMEPALRDLRDAQTTLIVQLDAMLTSPPKGLRMTARRRDALTDYLLDLIDSVMPHNADDTLIAIHDRYSDTPMQAILEGDEADEKAEIIAIFEQTFGKGTIQQAPDETHDAFMARARAQLFAELDAQERREDDARQRRAEKRAAKQDAKRRAKTPAVNATEPAAEPPKPDLLRTLYRKLASNLHPDRESDAAEKVRKTETMQGINTAYQNKDLLALLKLHNRTLQDDTIATDALAEDTLREYNALLKAQLATIESEIFRTIDEVTPPGVAMRSGRVKRPEQLERLMDNDIQHLRSTADSMLRTVRDLNDPKLRTHVINDLVEMSEERHEMDEFDGILSGFFDR